jgi:hypothetical protein
MSLSIPKTLFQTLQTSFDAEAKRIAKDVSKILNIDEKEILQVLKKIPKVQITLQDDSDASPICPVLLRGASSLICRCKKPCILGTSRCIEHQSVNSIPTTTEHLINLTKLSNETLEEPYWCDEETKNVYNKAGNEVGTLTEDNVLKIFTFEE